MLVRLNVKCVYVKEKVITMRQMKLVVIRHEISRSYANRIRSHSRHMLYDIHDFAFFFLFPPH